MYAIRSYYVRRRANGAITRKEYEQNADNISAMVKLLANEGLKGKEIAERLGISAARVSQLKKIKCAVTYM